MTRIKTSSALSEFLERVTREAVGETLQEDERSRQGQMSSDLSDFHAPANKKDNDEVEEEETTDDADEEKTKKVVKKDLTKLGSADKEPKSVDIPTSKDVTGAGLSDVIDQLNTLRSGKSLKDKSVRKNLDAYMSALSAGERQSLFVFLSGLSQIMANNIPYLALVCRS